MSPSTSFAFEDKLLRLVTPAEERTQPWKGRPVPGHTPTSLVDDMTNPNIRGQAMRETIVQTMRLGDQLYYWDGPWSTLGGSRGLAVVRDGRVVDTFVFMAS